MRTAIHARFVLTTLGALGALALGACSRGPVVCGPGLYPVGDGCVAFEADAGQDVERPDVGILDTGAPYPDAGDAGFPDPPDAEVYDSGVVAPGPVVTLGERGRILVTGRAVLTMAADNVAGPGEVYVEGDRIRCVGARGACAAMSGGASVVETQGVILPGLVNSHDHAAYDWLPIWMPGRTYGDHGQWQASSEYDAFTAPYAAASGDRASYCAMVQWGELRSLVGGATTLYGAVDSRTCFRWLVRNAELSTGYNGFDVDRMRSNVLGVSTLNATTAADLVAAMNTGSVTAYMIHVAEGVTTRARNELADLVRFNLLREETVIIHGTALTAADLADVARTGAKLVWSPSSNVALYGATTDIEAAQAAGISISIAPDWTPTGSGSVLAELRFAKRWIAEHTPGLYTDRELLEMATRIPAANMAIDRFVGTLEPGKLADLLVLEVDDLLPYASVIEARSQDVSLVMIGGVPTYGDPAIVGALRETPPSCHELAVCNVIRRACWVDPPDAPVSPASISAVIEAFYPDGPLDLFQCN